jgi:peptide methionine sulfoxide reductase MsrA
MDGVKHVVVGYTGGNQMSPTFRNLQDHTQALWIEYNPKLVSYWQLLQMWQDNDYPWEEETSSATRSALFVTNDMQYNLAHQFVSQLAERRPQSKLFVSVESATTFYHAEECHQNYLIKQAKAARAQLIMWANTEVQSGLLPIPE